MFDANHIWKLTRFGVTPPVIALEKVENPKRTRRHSANILGNRSIVKQYAQELTDGTLLNR
jgi:hypothetical protein